MKGDKLRKIIQHNNHYREEIARDCYMFYMSIGIQAPSVLADIQTVAEMIFMERGYKLLHIPLASDEIGAFQLRLNDSNYLVLNTAKNMAYNNVSVAHELYHIMIQKDNVKPLDIYNEEYNDDENEMMANAFAGNILMPESSFVLMFDKMHSIVSAQGKIGNDQDYATEYFVILLLMNYFKTTYMSVVVRCFELRKLSIDDSLLVDTLLRYNNKNDLSKFCEKYSSCIEPSTITQISYRDDFDNIIEDARRKGKEKIERGLLSQEDLEYKLDGMRQAYEEVVRKNVN